MITPEQCRAARALLRWTQDELATACNGVGVVTIRQFEAEKTAPRTLTLVAIQHALEKAGVMFIEDGAESPSGGCGVRLTRFECSMGFDRTLRLSDGSLISVHLQWAPESAPHRGEPVLCVTSIDSEGKMLDQLDSIDLAKAELPVIQKIYEMRPSSTQGYLDDFFQICDELGFDLDEETCKRAIAAVEGNMKVKG